MTNAVAEAGSGYLTFHEIYFYSDTACTQQIDVSSGTFTHGRVDGVSADYSSSYSASKAFDAQHGACSSLDSPCSSYDYHSVTGSQSSNGFSRTSYGSTNIARNVYVQATFPTAMDVGCVVAWYKSGSFFPHYSASQLLLQDCGKSYPVDLATSGACSSDGFCPCGAYGRMMSTQPSHTSCTPPPPFPPYSAPRPPPPPWPLPPYTVPPPPPPPPPPSPSPPPPKPPPPFPPFQPGVATNGALRLVGGASPLEGRVEILHNGVWGTVCDDSWSSNDAYVVCRQLGLTGGSYYTNAYFGQGTGPVWLSSASCGSSGSDLAGCSHGGWGVHHCSHAEDAGVSCSPASPPPSPPKPPPPPPPPPAPLPPPPPSPFQPIAYEDIGLRLVGGGSPLEGRVEILHDGVWGTVCDDSWSNYDVYVVCRQLGFTGGAYYTNAWFGQGTGPIWLSSVACESSGSDLASCQHSGWGVHSCSHADDAGVSCSPPSPPPSPPRPPPPPPLPPHVPIGTDVLRLVGGSNAFSGRVEIFHNGVWGTVCDDSWGTYNAQVVCRQLGLTSGSSYAAEPGSGPIWLDEVVCTGSWTSDEGYVANEADIASCSHNGWGEHDCGHAEDVGVSCGSHAPPPLPPQMPSPAPPAVVTLTMRAAGNVADYDDTSDLESRLAVAAGVEVDLVTIEVTAASVLITATIGVPAGSTASTVENTLRTSLGTTTTQASTVLGVIVETTPVFSAPPSPPPPPSPRPPPPSPPLQPPPEAPSLSVAMAAGAVAGLVLGLCCCCFCAVAAAFVIGYVVQRKKQGRGARGGGAAGAVPRLPEAPASTTSTTSTGGQVPNQQGQHDYNAPQNQPGAITSPITTAKEVWPPRQDTRGKAVAGASAYAAGPPSVVAVPMVGTELVALNSTVVTAAVPMAGVAVVAAAPAGAADGRGVVHGHKAHHADEDEMLERAMTEVASKEKPERQFEREISAKAAHAAVDGANSQKAEGKDALRQRLVEQHKVREASATPRATPRGAVQEQSQAHPLEC